MSTGIMRLLKQSTDQQEGELSSWTGVSVYTLTKAMAAGSYMKPAKSTLFGSAAIAVSQLMKERTQPRPRNDV
eukprot:4909201-Amphidinium_carterae.1